MPQGRHEAPWGARNLYTGGGAGTSITGPGMQVIKKRQAPRPKLSSVGVEAERAALVGMTVEQYRARDQPHQPGPTPAVEQTSGSVRDQPPQTRLLRSEDRDSGGWFYVDRQGDVQGPFGSARIREWVDAGALNPKVKVRPWHAQEFRQLDYFTRDGGPLASRPLLDAAAASQPAAAKPAALGVGSGAGGTAASPWIKVTEGQPPHVRQVWWNTLTNEKQLVKPAVPRVPLALHAGKAATAALEGLSGYGSGDSDSD